MTETTTPNIFPYVDGNPHKPPMEREELRDAINLSLWAGQMLLQNGADSARVEELIHRTGTGLGCDWMDIVVLPASITATTMNNEEFRTRVRRAPARGVNMTIIAEITELSYQVREGRLDRFGLRRELRRIDTLPPQYNRWMVVFGVGLACAAFSRLFGGDAVTFGVTFLAASAAMFVRQELHHRYFNPLIITMLTAMVAGICASLVTTLNPTGNADTAFSAAVLLLVPGVPLINSTEDLIRGHLVTGVARGIMGVLVSLAIALGLAIAIWLTGSRAL
jgi:uncharacterized membrane protein YjjP (DUF1212 family)